MLKIINNNICFDLIVFDDICNRNFTGVRGRDLSIGNKKFLMGNVQRGNNKEWDIVYCVSIELYLLHCYV